MLANLLEYIAFLLGFLTFCGVVGGGMYAFHYARLALMDRMADEQERQRRQQNPNIIPLDRNAIRHPSEFNRWHS